MSEKTDEKLESEELRIVPGFEELAPAWWAAVAEVHQVLLTEDAGIDAINQAYAKELLARWEYAKTLHERGYQVPDYLTEKAAVSPLWPTPELPAPVAAVAEAA
jgi:hypothetical protein